MRGELTNGSLRFGLTYGTRWCHRTFVDIPMTAKCCGCVDCRIIRAWRRLGRWFRE